MQVELGENVRRQRQPRAVGQRRDAHPARHAADALHVGHQHVRRAGLNDLLQPLRRVDLFAEADRRLDRAHDLGVVLEILVGDRVLDPRQLVRLQRVRQPVRMRARQRGAEIRHQIHFRSDRLTHGTHGGNVLGHIAAADPHLHRLESLLDEIAGFALQLVQVVGDPQPAGVGRNGIELAPEQVG